MIKKWKKGKWHYELCLKNNLITLSKRGGAETLAAPGEILFYTKTLENDAAALTEFKRLKEISDLNPEQLGFVSDYSALLN